jgi:hypothetical protein
MSAIAKRIWRALCGVFSSPFPAHMTEAEKSEMKKELTTY